jgi:hypothetical protein
MRTHEGSFTGRLGQGLWLISGVMGGLALVDAVLLFFFFLVLAPTSAATTNPYIGFVLFVALPVLAVVGATLAAIAYMVSSDAEPPPSGDEHHVGM